MIENTIKTAGKEPAPLFTLAPEQAARKLLLRQLKHAEAAGRRLADGKDARALHDFRVALRRLRALERSYRTWLEEALPKKLRKGLRDLGHRTGPARDGEVQLAWLEGQRQSLRPHQRSGYAWLKRRLEERVRDGYASIRAEVPLAFASLATLLRAALLMPCEGSAESFAQVTGVHLRLLAEALAADLADVETAEIGKLHAARLLAKRARYLLEPVAEAVDGGGRLVADLTALQDLLGELNDAEVLGATLANAAADAGAARFRELVQRSLEEASGGEAEPSPRDERAGLAALARRVRGRHQSAHLEVKARFRRGELQDLMARLAAAAETLAALGGPVRQPQAARNVAA
jgi:CHAD domain-containing protein